MGRGTTQSDDRHAGELFPQGRLRVRGSAPHVEGLFDDVVGRGWILIGAMSDPGRSLAAQERETFASLGGVTAHVGPGAPFEELDGRYRRFFERTGAHVALVRPDFRVFGTAKGDDAANSLVRALVRELESPTVIAD